MGFHSPLIRPYFLGGQTWHRGGTPLINQSRIPMGCLKKISKKVDPKDPEKSQGVAIGKSNHVFYINGMKENKKHMKNNF